MLKSIQTQQSDSASSVTEANSHALFQSSSTHSAPPLPLETSITVKTHCGVLDNSIPPVSGCLSRLHSGERYENFWYLSTSKNYNKVTNSDILPPQQPQEANIDTSSVTNTTGSVSGLQTGER